MHLLEFLEYFSFGVTCDFIITFKIMLDVSCVVFNVMKRDISSLLAAEIATCYRQTFFLCELNLPEISQCVLEVYFSNLDDLM